MLESSKFQRHHKFLHPLAAWVLLLCGCTEEQPSSADGWATVAADGTGGVDSAAGTMHVPSDESTSGDSEATSGADDESTTGDEPSTGGPHEGTTTGPDSVGEESSGGDTCEPETCASAGVECGTISNECGSTRNCGSCGQGETCNQGVCECVPSCGGLQCGLDAQCGVSCGTCGGGLVCELGACVPEIQVLDQVATADNLMLVSSTDPSQANTAYPGSNLAVGCTWAYSYVTNIQDYVCAASLVYFNVDATLANTSILSATLVFELDYTAATPTQYSIWGVASNWFANVTWNTMPLVVGGSEHVVGSPVSTAWPWEIDVTSVVQAWANGTYPNYGFLLEPSSVQFPYANLLQSTGICSLESCPGDFRPRLVVEYH